MGKGQGKKMKGLWDSREESKLVSGRQQIKTSKKHKKEEILYLLTHEGELWEYKTGLSGEAERSPRLRREAPESTESPARNRQEETLASIACPAAGPTGQWGRTQPGSRYWEWERGQVIATRHDPFYSQGTAPCVTQLIQEKANFIKFWKTAVTILPTRTLEGKEFQIAAKPGRNSSKLTSQADQRHFFSFLFYF